MDDDPGNGLGPIVKIGPARQAEAVARLLATERGVSSDHARRFIEYSRDHRITLDSMWARLDAQGRVEATVLAVPHPGRTAMVFASSAIDRASTRSLAGLIDHAAKELSSLRVNLAQVLLDPSETHQHEVFIAAGFQDLATLSYLERRLREGRAGRSACAVWPSGMTTVPFAESRRHELVDVLQRSYEDTLDCPGLRGYRRTEDILEGHCASGLFEPQLWTILRDGARAIGALLLNPSADHHSIELVYLGLAKEARGRGLGRQLLRYGFHLVRNRRERTMTLAVDEANAPAMSLYLQEGFQPALRRLALIRPIV